MAGFFEAVRNVGATPEEIKKRQQPVAVPSIASNPDLKQFGLQNGGNLQTLTARFQNAEQANVRGGVLPGYPNIATATTQKAVPVPAAAQVIAPISATSSPAVPAINPVRKAAPSPVGAPVSRAPGAAAQAGYITDGSFPPKTAEDIAMDTYNAPKAPAVPSIASMPFAGNDLNATVAAKFGNGFENVSNARQMDGSGPVQQHFIKRDEQGNQVDAVGHYTYPDGRQEWVASKGREAITGKEQQTAIPAIGQTSLTDADMKILNVGSPAVPSWYNQGAATTADDAHKSALRSSYTEAQKAAIDKGEKFYHPGNMKEASDDELGVILNKGYTQPKSVEATGRRERFNPLTEETTQTGVTSDALHPENIQFTRERDTFNAAREEAIKRAKAGNFMPGYEKGVKLPEGITQEAFQALPQNIQGEIIGHRVGVKSAGELRKTDAETGKLTAEAKIQIPSIATKNIADARESVAKADIGIPATAAYHNTEAEKNKVETKGIQDIQANGLHIKKAKADIYKDTATGNSQNADANLKNVTTKLAKDGEGPKGKQDKLLQESQSVYEKAHKSYLELVKDTMDETLTPEKKLANAELYATQEAQKYVQASVAMKKKKAEKNVVK